VDLIRDVLYCFEAGRTEAVDGGRGSCVGEAGGEGSSTDEVCGASIADLGVV